MKVEELRLDMKASSEEKISNQIINCSYFWVVEFDILISIYVSLYLPHLKKWFVFGKIIFPLF